MEPGRSRASSHTWAAAMAASWMWSCSAVAKQRRLQALVPPGSSPPRTSRSAFLRGERASARLPSPPRTRRSRSPPSAAGISATTAPFSPPSNDDGLRGHRSTRTERTPQPADKLLLARWLIFRDCGNTVSPMRTLVTGSAADHGRVAPGPHPEARLLLDVGLARGQHANPDRMADRPRSGGSRGVRDE